MTATFHSKRGKKLALVLVKRHKLQVGTSPVYVNREGCEKASKGDVIELPEGCSFATMTIEGNTFKSKDGSPLKFLNI